MEPERYRTELAKFEKAFGAKVRDAGAFVDQVLARNVPMSHGRFVELLAAQSGAGAEDVQAALRDVLLAFVQQYAAGEHDAAAEAWEEQLGDNALLKAERAFYVLAELTGDHGWLSHIDSLENRDLAQSLERSLGELQREVRETAFEYAGGDVSARFVATGPMKIALSSANNSDRHGAAKLEGSLVFNMAGNLIPHGSTDRVPAPPIRVEIALMDTAETGGDAQIQFRNFCDLTGHHELHSLDIGRASLADRFFSFPPGVTLASAPDLSQAFANSNDHFRFFKYALVFSHIVPIECLDEEPDCHPKDAVAKGKLLDAMWSGFVRFTRGRTLRVSVESLGPSRSGFSSSSAVMCALLSALFESSGHERLLTRVEDLALLAENRLSLRSGWNDTYSTQAGIHNFSTDPTALLPAPALRPLRHLHPSKLMERLVLIHTGIQRLATGRMNRRHEVYLSKDPEPFALLCESFASHHRLVDALDRDDFCAAGREMTAYMELRAGFDSGAVSDLLRFFFTFLLDKGLIHGGLLAGAMGGGIAQVMVTDAGQNRSALEAALDALKAAEPRFDNELFGRIEYAVNEDGIRVERV